MRRREFIRGIAGSTVAWPLPVQAQQASNKIPLIGVLWHAGSAEEEDVYLSFLMKGFHDLGYIEGKNIHLDQRFPAENPERFRKLGQELVDNQRLRGANYWSTLGQVQGDQVASQGGLGD